MTGSKPWTRKGVRFFFWQSEIQNEKEQIWKKFVQVQTPTAQAWHLWVITLSWLIDWLVGLFVYHFVFFSPVWVCFNKISFDLDCVTAFLLVLFLL